MAPMSANASAHFMPPIDPTLQCEAANALPMLLNLVLLYTSAIYRNRQLVLAACALGVVASTAYALNVRGIKELTLAHLMVGALGFEGAVRVAKTPLFTANSRAELAFCALCIFPNLMVTLGETFFHNSGHSLTFTQRSFAEYQHNHFFKKQHAFLHSAIIMLLSSTASSYWPRLRRSVRVQAARVFIEPSCLVAVAMILMTHDHGASTTTKHELDTHPIIGALMILAALCHTVTAGVHYAYPTPTGGPPDLCTPLPGGGPAPLRLLRLATAYAYMLFAIFLFVDTFMEYLGCRAVIVTVGDEHDPARVGWNPRTEESTYLAAAVLGAVFTLSFVIVPLVGDGLHSDSRNADKEESEERSALLPLALVRASDAEMPPGAGLETGERPPSEGSAEGSA